MRKLAFCSSFLAIFFSFHHCLGQEIKELDAGYYVVVAAYAPAREDLASKYTALLNKRGISARYGFNSRRNLFFVYLQYFTDLKSSLRQMYETRKTGQFTDAWVRVVSGDINTRSPQAVAVTPLPESEAAPQAESEHADPAEKVSVRDSMEARDAVNKASTAVLYDDISENPEIIQYQKITLGNTEVFLSLFNATNNRIVDGTVKVVDTEKTKLIREVKGNDYLYLPDPKNKSGQLTLICEAFGYRKVQQEINYPLPLADTIKEYIDLMGTTFIIYFDLIRYHQGDKATLYHVYFFNDAAIMLPESKFELTSLLEMLRENTHYRIRLHGHTNGNYHGRIILMGPANNFFSLDGSTNTVGSAKDLARSRAQVIKTYLVSNGIAADRIEIKAWGGKKPIYDKHSANAKKNVRVEVEILQE
jgi:outer membrane protein OmpA-like peptidoglycan-associated protein